MKTGAGRSGGWDLRRVREGGHYEKKRDQDGLFFIDPDANGLQLRHRAQDGKSRQNYC